MQLRACLLIWPLLVWSYTRTLDDADWDGLLPDLTSLCPNVNFCGKTQPHVEQDAVETNSCCRGCSCDSNCSITRDCCDGTGDDDSLSECLVPSTNQDLRLNTYRFIVQPPADGCKKIPRKSHVENVTCSSEEKVAPWGNFFPVYSKSLDVNFKNEPCARCHGALDVKKWTSILQIDYAPLFVGTLTQFIEKDVLGECDIVFRPPNSESSTFEKLCFREIRFCPKNEYKSFYILSNTQMNRSSIIQACEQGPSAKYLGPHGTAFKNVFCAVCNGYALKFNDKLICQNTLDTNKELDPPIRVLLDSDYIASLTEKNDIVKKTDGACYRPKDNMNQSICEGTFCPSMQIRLQSGKCGYVTKFLMIENLILCLNLSTTQGHDADAIKNMTDTYIHSLFKKETPWSDKWFITFIGLLISEKPRWLEFLICLKLNSRQANMEALRKEVGTSLTKGWRVDFKVATIFRQTISKDGPILTGVLGNNVTAEWNFFKTNFEENLRAPIWKIMFTLDLDLHSPVYFNQMFMCEQVQLHPDEYKHASPESVLYQPKRHQYLYPNEFTALLDTDGSWQVRVCLKDSGYIKVNSGAGSLLWAPVNLFIPIVSYNVIRILVVTNTV